MCLVLPTTLVVRIPVEQLIGYVCVCLCVYVSGEYLSNKMTFAIFGMVIHLHAV